MFLSKDRKDPKDPKCQNKNQIPKKIPNTKQLQKSLKRASTIIPIYKSRGIKAKKMLSNFVHEARRGSPRARTWVLVHTKWHLFHFHPCFTAIMGSKAMPTPVITYLTAANPKNTKAIYTPCPNLPAFDRGWAQLQCNSVFPSKNAAFFLFQKASEALKDRVLTRSHQYAPLTNTNVKQ